MTHSEEIEALRKEFNDRLDALEGMTPFIKFYKALHPSAPFPPYRNGNSTLTWNAALEWAKGQFSDREDDSFCGSWIQERISQGIEK